MNTVFNIIKIVVVIIGTIIGAGFASGKEIYIFFAQYEEIGIIGAIIASILAAIIIYSTILIVKKYKIQNNNEFVEHISNNNEITQILKNIINIFLVISFWIMSTGFCTFFKQEMGIPLIVTAIINSIITYILLLKKVDGVIKLNLIVVPIMIIIIMFVSIKNYQVTSLLGAKLNIVSPNDTNTSIKELFKVIINAILYISYNSITVITIIISLGSKITSKKENKYISIVSGCIIGILILAIYQMLTSCSINVSNLELPILRILDECHPIEKSIYSIAIITAILTSAISSGYGVLENIENKEKYKKIAFIICILEIPIAYIGFGRLISALYPTFGIIGIIEIISILKKANSIAKDDENWYKIYREIER